ncbi:MAG: hypothetical protein MUF61_00125 [archaeon]|jgi:flagellin-like protein|nr:hypothetical protein [archaeon]
MKRNKRGVSPVIATVFVLMLTVSAVALIAGFLVPFVKKSLYKSSECVNYKEVYSFEESLGYNCVQKTEGLYAISVKAKFDKELLGGVAGFRVVFKNADGTSKGIEVKNDTSASNEQGGIRLLGREGLRIPAAGETITYVYRGASGETFASAEVYPVLNSGTICGEKDSIELIQCKNRIS